MLLIGSGALFQNNIGLSRIPRDTDYISTYDEFSTLIARLKGANALVSCYPINGNHFVAHTKTNYGIYEFEVAWPGSTAAQLLDLERDRWYASLEACLALKLSHRYLRNSPAFKKTMDDIRLLRKAGVEITPKFREWIKVRERETYNYTHPKLDQAKKDFFDPSVKYIYDHDTVHQAVAVGCHPAYTFYKDENAEVQCSKQKFFELPEQVRLNGVYEEACVLALERSIIPHPGVWSPDKAFEYALMKVCTSITSGWFRNFAWEHYYEVMEMYTSGNHRHFLTRFKEALEVGEVLPAQHD